MCAKIFFSYTLRDGEISKDILLKIKQQFERFSELETYFDLLDNHSTNHQEYVYSALANANILCLIKSPAINVSIWVRKELYVAKIRNLPIVEISKKEVVQIVNNKTKNEFINHPKIKEIMNSIAWV